MSSFVGTPRAPAPLAEPVSIGVIGLGAFGRFCLEAYLGMPDVRVVAIADVAPNALAEGWRLAPGAQPFDDGMALIASPDVDLVTLCAPPDRHLTLVLAAALAGKHVLCDKPLGLSLAEFDTAVATTAMYGVALGINLMLRHNSIYQTLYTLARSGALGTPRRVSVENYADEGIGFGPTHWLWDPSCSGGLALASDIHWLDVAGHVLGQAYEAHTWSIGPGEGIGPRRLTTTTHGQGAVASVYHAFDTCPGATGCTVLAAFDEGEARIDGWIPRRLTVRCPADRLAATAAVLGAVALPEVSIEEDGRAALTLHSARDRRAEYLEMIRAALRLVLAKAKGDGVDGADLTMARMATAAALAAEQAAVSRTWVAVEPEGGPYEAVG